MKHSILRLTILGFLVLSILVGANTKVFAATVALTWDAPTTNVDGSLLTDLAGYRLYYGTSSGNYGQPIDVGNVTTYTVTNLSDNTTYYFAVTARDTSNKESTYSNEECFNSAGSCGGSGGGGNQNASNTGDTEISGGGCGFVKDDNNSSKMSKSQGIVGESGNIFITANLALLFLFLTLLKLRVIFYRNMGGYRMKMNKLFSLLMLSLAFCLQPSALNAAVNLPWSTTYKCPDWIQSGLDNVNCDGLSKDGDWITVNGSKEQITASANYSGGAGGKGQRHWMGDGVNNISGGLELIFASPQSELWMRWYMRYEQGFQWNPLNNQKILYFDPRGVARLVVGYCGVDSCGVDRIRFYSYTVNQAYNSAAGEGWNGVMKNGSTDANGNKTSDGQWHLWEVHIKMDTNGSNGILELWVDQKKVINVTNANLGTTLLYTVSIGENGFNPNNGKDMYIDYDDIAISNTGPIGPICPDCPDSPKKLRK